MTTLGIVQTDWDTNRIFVDLKDNYNRCIQKQFLKSAIEEACILRSNGQVVSVELWGKGGRCILSASGLSSNLCELVEAINSGKHPKPKKAEAEPVRND